MFCFSGTPSHAAEAMELGADDRMAVAIKQAVETGRTVYKLGLGAPLDTASATSPLTAFLN